MTARWVRYQRPAQRFFFGDVQGGLGRLLVAMGGASEVGWGQMVAFGTISLGVGHILAGRIGKGIKILESAIAAYDARGEVIYATATGLPLAGISLEMLTNPAKPPLSIILRNFGWVLRVKFFGVRRIEALLDQASRDPHLHEHGATRTDQHEHGPPAQIQAGTRARTAISRESEGSGTASSAATDLVTKIDAALAELR